MKQRTFRYTPFTVQTNRGLYVVGPVTLTATKKNGQSWHAAEADAVADFTSDMVNRLKYLGIA